MLLSLPDDVIVYICEFLPWKMMITFEKTCKKVRKIMLSKADLLWKKQYLNTFGTLGFADALIVHKKIGLNWKSIFIEKNTEIVLGISCQGGI
jgi:hypothetical protein